MYGPGPSGAPSIQNTYSPTPNSSGQYTSSNNGFQPQSPAVKQASVVARRFFEQRGPGGGKGGKGGKKKNGIPTLAKYLTGDSTYQSQLSQLNQQLANFKTANTANQANVNQDFNTALTRMGDQRTSDLHNLQGDYASRGILNSGLFTDANSQYDTKYQQQLGDYSTDKQRSLSDLLSSLQNYTLENTTADQNAKADAIRRRAQKYGLTG